MIFYHLGYSFRNIHESSLALPPALQALSRSITAESSTLHIVTDWIQTGNQMSQILSDLTKNSTI